MIETTIINKCAYSFGRECWHSENTSYLSLFMLLTVIIPLAALLSFCTMNLPVFLHRNDVCLVDPQVFLSHALKGSVAALASTALSRGVVYAPV